MGEGAPQGCPWEDDGVGKLMANRGLTCSRVCHPVTARTAPTRTGVGLGHPVERCLASTGRRDGGWVCRKFQMAEDLADDLTLRDDGDDP